MRAWVGVWRRRRRRAEAGRGRDERQAVGGAREVRMDGVQWGEREENLSGTKDLQD